MYEIQRHVKMTYIDDTNVWKKLNQSGSFKTPKFSKTFGEKAVSACGTCLSDNKLLQILSMGNAGSALGGLRASAPLPETDVVENVQDLVRFVNPAFSYSYATLLPFF